MEFRERLAQELLQVMHTHYVRGGDPLSETLALKLADYVISRAAPDELVAKAVKRG